MALGEQMAAEMQEQPAVLRRLTSQAPALTAAIRAVVPAPLAGSVFLARGSSDNAALLGRYLAEMFGHRPAGMAAPSLYTRYGAHVDHRGYLVVALSQSGATPEVVSTSAAMRRAGATVVAVTNEPDSALAGTADALLLTQAGPECAVPATKTVTAQMLLMTLIAMSLDAESADRTVLDGVADAVAAVLADDGPAAALARRWENVERLYVTGRGLLYPAALETALKIKETTGILAEGLSIADLLHGPISAAGHGTPVLVLGPDRHTRRDVDEVRDRLAAMGADVAFASAGSASHLPLPSSDEPATRVIAATVRGQQLALHLARRRGLDPDRPVGLSKVTPTV